MTESMQSNVRTPWRLWPGVVFVAVLWLCWSVAPRIFPDSGPVPFFGAAIGGLLVIVWWLFFSRAPWLERVGAPVLMVAAVALVSRFVHPSIATGHMGMTLPIYAIPVMCLTLVVWAAVARRWPAAWRRAALAGSVVIAASLFTLIRSDGIMGTGASLFRWRWTPTAEERLLAAATPGVASASESGSRPLPDAPRVDVDAAPPTQPEAPAAAAPQEAARVPGPQPVPAAGDSSPRAAGSASPGDSDGEDARPRRWPGFRGPDRDARVSGIRIATDWNAAPPVQIWRRAVGPGWSSFAVAGSLVYTQEQRGDDELVTCYSLESGDPVWMHRDEARFWESNAGAGPRATPVVHGSRVYAMGATGIVNALDARTGRRLWTRNAQQDTGATLPGWGFSGSPLVVDDLVVVAASGRLIAYDRQTGTPRWKGPTGGGGGYSSPHLVTLDGVEQIVLLRGGGAVGVAIADGAVLWQHAWQQGTSIVQPAIADGDLVIAGGDMMGGIGLRRLAVARGGSEWTATERWTTRGLKPYFNDFVVHEGHAYGFDGSILASVSLSDGTRTWKGGRYGAGQMLLLPEQDLLLVLAEEGDLALVSAAPDKFTELARVKGLDGKTWNHPAMAGHILLVRNGEEMAAFRLSAGAAGTH
jgi:outer membrane protein assembly factor BamB